MKLSEHFELEEFYQSPTAEADNINNYPPEWVISNLQYLVDELLEPLRVKLDKPIHITSGYRCPELNKAIGGVNKKKVVSQHTKGQAVDIKLGDRTKEENKIMFDTIAENFDYDQLIDEKDYKWVHVSLVKENNRHQILHL